MVRCRIVKIVTAAQIVTALQTIVSRQVNLPEGAAVVTVGQLHGGNRNNIIPEQATLSGTIRTLNEDTRTLIHSAVTEIAQHTAQAFGLNAVVDIGRSYPVLRNDPELTAKILPALQRAAGRDRVVETPPQLASEDFGAFSTKVPGVFWFLNASPYPDRAGAANHSPLFEIDEQYLKTGVRALVSVTLDYLETAAAEAKTP
jgi:amidohydrolase